MTYDYREKLHMFNGPKAYNVRHFVDGHFYCLEGKSPYWDNPLFYDAGYEVYNYYVELNEVVETVDNLFSKVYPAIEEIGKKGTISINNKPIKDEFNSYKEIERFFDDNYMTSNYMSSTAKSVEEGKGGGVKITSPISLSISDYCIKSMAFDDGVLASKYNTEQEKRDNRLFETLKRDYDRKWDEYLQGGEIVKHHKIETAWDEIKTSVYDIFNSK